MIFIKLYQILVSKIETQVKDLMRTLITRDHKFVFLSDVIQLVGYTVYFKK